MLGVMIYTILIKPTDWCKLKYEHWFNENMQIEMIMMVNYHRCFVSIK